MIRTINKNFLILLGVFIGASVLRISLDKSEYINNIISFINVASLLYVFYLILENSGKQLIHLLNQDNILGEHIKGKKKLYYKSTTNWICIISLIWGIVYSLFFSNCITNDIIGTIALFLSIQADYISISIGYFFYKKR